MLPKIGTDSFGMMVRRSTSRYRTVSWLNQTNAAVAQEEVPAFSARNQRWSSAPLNFVDEAVAACSFQRTAHSSGLFH
jgi:hypothetical protein